MARVRTANASNTFVGSWYRSSASQGTRTVTITIENRCEDSNPGPGGLNVYHTRPVVFLLNGTNPSNPLQFVSNLPATYRIVPSASTLMSDNSNRLWSLTNPARPNVSIPNILFELKDLPELIRIRGSSHLQKLASGYLNYKFGWEATLRDLKSLVQTYAGVESRFRELEQLASGEGLRRRVVLDRASDTVKTNNVSIESVTFGVTCNIVKTTTGTQWGTIRWLPSKSSLPKSREERMLQAQRLVFGYHPSNWLLASWNALPWTFLIDYGVNVSSFLQGTNNAIAYVPRTPWLMTSYDNHLTGERVPGGNQFWISATPLPGYRKTRYRQVAAPSLLPSSLPALTGNQLATLTALAAKYL